MRGAAVVSIIPVRGGNGELERLAKLGRFTPPTLNQLESALDRCIAKGSVPFEKTKGTLPFNHSARNTVVTADLWDVDRLPACSLCRESRIERLHRLNVTGMPQSPIVCSMCDRP